MVVLHERLSPLLLLFFYLPFPVTSIDCENLVEDDLRAIDRVVVACADATALGRAPGTSPKALDVSSLNDEQFFMLFSKKTTLEMGITAVNSKLSNMSFPELTSFYDTGNRILLRLVNNRQLRYIGLPKLPKGSLVSSKDPKHSPVYIVGNPLLPYKNIKELQNLSDSNVWWEKNIRNSFGYCVFTNVIRNLSDLNNCWTVGGNLIIDEASGDTTTPYLEVDGFLSITNSNITNIDFLSGIKNNYIKDTDDEPATTCFGGDLRIPATRSVIESGRCRTVFGDLVIENIINSESDLTESLRAGLSGIQRVLNGSVYIIFNEALDKIDFLPNLVEIRPQVYQGQCKVAGLDISANFNLTSVELNSGLKVFYDPDLDDCVYVSIGANGPEGREYGMEEGQMEHLRQQFGMGLKLWTHPRSPAIIKEEIERKERNESQYRLLLAGTIVSGIGCLLATSFSIYKLCKRSQAKKNGSEGADDKTNQSKESKNRKAKKNKKRNGKNVAHGDTKGAQIIPKSA